MQKSRTTAEQASRREGVNSWITAMPAPTTDRRKQTVGRARPTTGCKEGSTHPAPVKEHGLSIDDALDAVVGLRCWTTVHAQTAGSIETAHRENQEQRV